MDKDRAELLRQMIAEKERLIELYHAMIGEWRREIGEGGPVAAGATQSAVSAGREPIGGGDPISTVREFEFHNKSQTEAARIVLDRVGYPLTTQQIIDAIARGGVNVGGKTPQAQKTNFYTILHRSKKDFGLAAKDRWGLRGWKGIPKREGKDENGDEPKEAEDKK